VVVSAENPPCPPSQLFFFNAVLLRLPFPYPTRVPDQPSCRRIAAAFDSPPPYPDDHLRPFDGELELDFFRSTEVAMVPLPTRHRTSLQGYRETDGHRLKRQDLGPHDHCNLVSFLTSCAGIF